MMTLEDQLMDKKERRHQLNLSDDGYFNSLPREIILFILSHLDFRSLIQCCQVSKSFRDIASDPLLYSRLELKHLWHKVSNATLKSVFRKTKLLKYLDISHCGNYGRLTPVTLRTFIYARGAKLTNLLLQNCHAATKIVLVSIGATCKQLVDLDLSNLHYIETGNFGPIALLNNLQQLNLYRTRIGTRELSDIIKSNASTLRALYLGSCLRIDADKICEILSNESCNMLSVLDLWRSNSLTSRGVTHLSSISSLIDLDLGTYLSSWKRRRKMTENQLIFASCIYRMVRQSQFWMCSNLGVVQMHPIAKIDSDFTSTNVRFRHWVYLSTWQDTWAV